MMAHVMRGLRWAIGAALMVGALVRPVSAQVALHAVAITTSGAGAATAYTPSVQGIVRLIRYVPHATTPLDGAATLTITDNTTGMTILSVSALGSVARDFAVRIWTVDTTGATALYAAGGVSVREAIPIDGALKIVVAAGGATTSGTVYVLVEGR